MKSPDRHTESAFRTYGLFSTAALELGLSVAAGVFGGKWVDQRFGTSPWLMVLGLILGCVLGFYLLYQALLKNKRVDDN